MDKRPMDKKEFEVDNENQLREDIMHHAPRPSAAHNETIMQAARANAAKQNRSKRPGRSWLMMGAGLAASAVLAVSVGQLLPTNPSPVEINQRGPSDHAVWPAENLTLGSEPNELRWTAQPGAERYQVNIYSDSAELLWQSIWTTEARVRAPGIRELMFASGARYFWVVEIDGTSSRLSLGPYWFRIE
jgi:hypothetical protein